ncbi:MAG: shikimate kinase [Gammaproteobacteria bacterium]
MRFAILGNSGSGKSTLAGWLAGSAGVEVLDLDSVAWESGQPAVLRATGSVRAEVETFCVSRPRWVLEGCYANLIEVALQFEPHLVFLNPGLDSCVANCLNRAWEPHKYVSRQAQDANLDFLLSWVAEYYTRDGPMSLRAHREVFSAYTGSKTELRRVPVLDPPEPEMLAWPHWMCG